MDAGRLVEQPEAGLPWRFLQPGFLLAADPGEIGRGPGDALATQQAEADATDPWCDYVMSASDAAELAASLRDAGCGEVGECRD